MRKQIKKTKLLKIFFTFATICCAITLVILMQNENMINPIKNEETAMPLTIESKEKNTANYYEVTSTDGKKVPVPKGYRASDVPAERSVNGGFVIYEGEDEPVPTDEAGLMQAQINRNQWVWIPISSEEFENMYHVSGNEIYANSYEYEKTGTTPTLKTSENLEPLLGAGDVDFGFLMKELNDITIQQFEMEIRKRFYEMLQSVKTYGGFYISRYEISDLNQNIPSSKRLHGNIRGRTNWHNFYAKCKRLKGKNETVDTNMIWGIQYNETLNWLIDTGNKTYNEIANDSTSWGNYVQSTFTYYSNAEGTSTETKIADRTIEDSKIRAGLTDYSKSNNIFDLAGNVWDWTMLASDSYKGNRVRFWWH